MLALPIFPARLQASIFGADELNFRVRDGNGWTLIAINTDLFILTDSSAKIKHYLLKSISKSKRYAWIWGGKAAEKVSFRVLAEATDPQLALTW